jgi:hypothetical protein
MGDRSLRSSFGDVSVVSYLFLGGVYVSCRSEKHDHGCGGFATCDSGRRLWDSGVWFTDGDVDGKVILAEGAGKR